MNHLDSLDAILENLEREKLQLMAQLAVCNESIANILQVQRNIYRERHSNLNQGVFTQNSSFGNNLSLAASKETKQLNSSHALDDSNLVGNDAKQLIPNADFDRGRRSSASPGFKSQGTGDILEAINANPKQETLSKRILNNEQTQLTLGVDEQLEKEPVTFSPEEQEFLELKALEKEIKQWIKKAQVTTFTVDFLAEVLNYNRYLILRSLELGEDKVWIRKAKNVWEVCSPTKLAKKDCAEEVCLENSQSESQNLSSNLDLSVDKKKQRNVSTRDLFDVNYSQIVNRYFNDRFAVLCNIFYKNPDTVFNAQDLFIAIFPKTIREKLYQKEISRIKQAIRQILSSKSFQGNWQRIDSGKYMYNENI
ncbi:MAG: hypothetical protein RLZZ499_2619 [Cyanobacteriota bacterium]|jgi:hypothetical protein